MSANESKFDYEKFMKEILEEMEKDEEEGRKNKPKVIAILKKKLVIAVNEIPEEISKEDEDTVASFTSSMFFPFAIANMFKPESIVWDDSKANQKVEEILKKHAKFDLSTYLQCAKLVFLCYTGKTELVTDAMEYVLTHARQFGDTTKVIFQINESKENPEQDSEVRSDREKLALTPLPNNKLLNKISQLILDLTTTFDETKFAILNVNTTYFTLLMLRRIVKNEAQFSNAFKKIQTHDNYVKLCPAPLDNQLPKCELKIFEKRLVDCAYLAISTYLNTKDETTTRVLRATSILYMEWNGLQLPQLFFKVVNLYKVKAEDLFDLLFTENCSSGELSTCFNFADHYYDSYKRLKQGVTNSWFPYCRVLDGAYHLKLSAKENVDICTVLAYLVDLKIGFDKSTIRKSHWVKLQFKELLQTAKKLHEILNEQQLNL